MWIALMLVFVLFIPASLWFAHRYEVPVQVLYAGISTGMVGVFTCGAFAFPSYRALFFFGAAFQGLAAVVSGAWSWQQLKGKPLVRRSPSVS